MTADLTPYPAMKDSGLPWLGEVPAHWEVRRLRDAVEMRVSNVDKHTKLHEYRTRLIADVVTGKLDVREAAAQLPDEADEPEPADEAEALLDGEESQADDLDAIPEEAEA